MFTGKKKKVQMLCQAKLGGFAWVILPLYIMEQACHLTHVFPASSA